MHFYKYVVDLGAAEVTLPLAGAVSILLILRREYVRVCWWLCSLTAGVAVIIGAKMAFDFAGYAMPDIALYSVSGHAMLSAALYPVFFGMLLGVGRRHRLNWAVVGGGGLALIICVELVANHYHTVSETALGAAVGLAVAATTAGRVEGFRKPTGMALLAITCFGFVFRPEAALHAAKLQLWSQTGEWFGIHGSYTRIITRDSATGDTIVIVRPPKSGYIPSNGVMAQSRVLSLNALYAECNIVR